MVELKRLRNREASVLNRPRISMELDRYIWDYIDEKIIKPKKILESDKWVYQIHICFTKYDESKHKFFTNNEYNPNFGDNKLDLVECKLGDSDRLFDLRKFRILEGNTKFTIIYVCSPLVAADMTPEQYADLLFDGFGSFLVYNFKKVRKVELDEIKEGLSKDIILSFQFPASLEKQEYWDDGDMFADGKSIREYYKNYFHF